MITRYDPFREAMSLRRAMDQLFEQSIVNPGLLAGAPSVQTAPMDICETDTGYEIDVALPGVRPDDIELTVDQSTLTLRGRYSHQNEHYEQVQGKTQQPQQSPVQQQQGQQPQQSPVQQQQGQQPQQSPMQQPQGQQRQQQGESWQSKRHPRADGHNWLVRELPSGSFERSITLPKPIDPNGIVTNFEDGILTVQVPVSEASRPRRISITGTPGQGHARTIEAEQRQPGESPSAGRW